MFEISDFKKEYMLECVLYMFVWLIIRIIAAIYLGS